MFDKLFRMDLRIGSLEPGEDGRKGTGSQEQDESVGILGSIWDPSFGHNNLTGLRVA